MVANWLNWLTGKCDLSLYTFMYMLLGLFFSGGVFSQYELDRREQEINHWSANLQEKENEYKRR